MDTIDNPVVEPQSASFWPKAVRYGLIGGLIFIIYNLAATTLGLLDFSNMGMIALNAVIGLAITVVIIALAIAAHRKEDLGGFISFKQAFAVGFFTILIAGIISAIWGFIYANYINPEFYVEMIENMEVYFEKLGLNDDQIAEAIEKTEKRMQPGRMFISGLLNSVIGGAIFSAITGAIMKRNPPVA